MIELSDRTEEIFAEPDAGEELFALRFILHAKDVNSFNLWEYFTSVKGIIMTPFTDVKYSHKLKLLTSFACRIKRKANSSSPASGSAKISSVLSLSSIIQIT